MGRKERILYTDGIIHTMESETAVASSMLVEDGRILELDVDESTCKGAKKISLHNRHVYPCLIDGHVHLLYTVILSAAGFSICEIRDGRVVPENLAGIEKRLREFTQGKPKDAIITGNGYIMTGIAEHRLPNRRELDEWCGGRPTVIYTIDGHASALSTSMMKHLGMDPEGSDGILSGEAHERVQGRITDIIAAGVTPLVLAQGIANFHNTCAKYGISMVGALEGNGDSDKDPTTRLITMLARHFDVGVKFYYQYRDTAKAEPLSRYQKEKRIGGCGDWEMDGSIGAHSAAFSHPYKDTGKQSAPYYSQEEADEMVRCADEAGYQIGSHAIGDLAVERLTRALCHAGNGRKHRVEHCEFASEESIRCIAQHGFAVMAQPGYSWIDQRFLHTYDRYLTEETLQMMHFKTFIDQGICICGSSDSPVQSMDPWLQMLGMTEFYRQEESVSPYEALRCYTVNPAIAMEEEKERGRLLCGMRADFFTSDQDLFTLSPEELGSFRPEQTFYAGKKARVWKGTVAELLQMLLKKGHKV